MLYFSILMALLGAAGGWFTPLDRFVSTTSPLVVTFSIMGAAIFVRMNRGMPTLDWASLEQGGRERLTSRILEITKEYMVILAVQAVALVSLITLSTFNSAAAAATSPLSCSANPGATSPLSCLPSDLQHVVGAFLGLTLALSFARMTYVVWRDYDIVRLQKRLIDESGRRLAVQQNTAAATAKIAAMKSSGLRPVPSAAPKTWTD